MRWVSRSTPACPCSSTTRGWCTCSSTPTPTSTWRRRIVVNAKAQRPSVCNALETLLVHRAVAEPLPARDRRAPGRGRRRAPRMPADAARACPRARPATDGRLGRGVPRPDPGRSAWSTDLEAAIAHIARHGTGLAEAIVTNDLGARPPLHARGRRGRACSSTPRRGWWTAASSGMGAEMGISTSRVHARGPVGVTRADDDQVRRAGRRAGPGLSRWRPGDARLSAGRSIRSTTAILLLADEVVEMLGLDRVLFVPAAAPPHKSRGRSGARRRPLRDGRARHRRPPEASRCPTSSCGGPVPRTRSTR